ncbi:Gfo/Idh/MocA family protein [Aquibacillus albus]|uniref:Dehydrogenase n=1 Tax=Aquibacillus albus TaxID=1168171 RepID=A0ABS2MWT4_9BACI|nr:Gfo/Idh/MocA family oxidoreductase [Aquibacillus albus]MBM7570347.1 putative dehydrogenase [Aquibacillus albus]
MNKNVSIVLIGISGYGHSYLKELFGDNYENAYLSGVVDINPKRSDYYNEIIDRKIPIYENLEAFYDDNKADLAIISTPIHLHKQQACCAMNNGSHVLCEKPMTANPDDITEMIETRDRTGKFLAIGFNWSFAPSVQALKKDILNGTFGKPKRLKSLVLWPRNLDYFARSGWAGKKYSPSGEMIFDSVANNATAHFIHHLFYLTGPSIEKSSTIKQVTAELYLTNDIETFDTCAVHVQTTQNLDIYYYASHAIKEEVHPRFELEFEHATISYAPGSGNDNVIAYLADGTKKLYEDPMLDKLAKLSVCIEAIQKGNHAILCGAEAASSHVAFVQAMHQSVPDVPTFPQHLVNYEKDQKLYWIDGLGDILTNCYNNWTLPSDIGVEWSKKGKTIENKLVFS